MKFYVVTVAVLVMGVNAMPMGSDKKQDQVGTTFPAITISQSIRSLPFSFESVNPFKSVEPIKPVDPILSRNAKFPMKPVPKGGLKMTAKRTTAVKSSNKWGMMPKMVDQSDKPVVNPNDMLSGLAHGNEQPWAPQNRESVAHIDDELRPVQKPSRVHKVIGPQLPAEQVHRPMGPADQAVVPHVRIPDVKPVPQPQPELAIIPYVPPIFGGQGEVPLPPIRDVLGGHGRGVMEVMNRPIEQGQFVVPATVFGGSAHAGQDPVVAPVAAQAQPAAAAAPVAQVPPVVLRPPAARAPVTAQAPIVAQVPVTPIAARPPVASRKSRVSEIVPKPVHQPQPLPIVINDSNGGNVQSPQTPSTHVQNPIPSSHDDSKHPKPSIMNTKNIMAAIAAMTVISGAMYATRKIKRRWNRNRNMTESMISVPVNVTKKLRRKK